MRLVPKRLRWMGLGALAAWLFDPERGRTRRNQIADRASEVMRKVGIDPESKSRVEPGRPVGSPASSPTDSVSRPSPEPAHTGARPAANSTSSF